MWNSVDISETQLTYVEMCSCMWYRIYIFGTVLILWNNLIYVEQSLYSGMRFDICGDLLIYLE